MEFSFLISLLEQIRDHADRNAFFINEKSFSYREFGIRISEIQRLVVMNTHTDEKQIGIFTFDELNTYASIYALWFLGKAFVPLNPLYPSSRNESIIRQAGLSTVISCSEIPDSALDPSLSIRKLNNYNVDASGTSQSECLNDDTDELAYNETGIIYKNVSSTELAYILFTSGSTGQPKGVPISRHNLNVYIRDYLNYHDFTPDDRFLQIYDLSFDGSIPCYVVPLCLGAGIYTVPQDQIKYLYAYKLMTYQKLTVIKMPPSTLVYLLPYADTIHLPDVRYSLFGGEELSAHFIEAWAPSIPNARIQNVYGPTEATVNILFYEWHSMREKPKMYNGIVSLGKTFGTNILINLDENDTPVGENQIGELCIAGDQLTKGYWNNQQKNERSFFELKINGQNLVFYRTGDLVLMDDEGDYMFCGRKDAQIQVQGYRVELGEIESHARNFLGNSNVVAMGHSNSSAVVEIMLFVENIAGRQDMLEAYLEKELPAYMIPRVICVPEFPKSAGGKISLSGLKEYIK